VKTVNGEEKIQALMDKKKVIITETSVRSDLHLEDTEDENETTTSNDPLLSGKDRLKEDASKQGRMIDDLDADEGVALVDKTQGRNDQDMFDTSILDDEEVVAEKEVSTVDPVPTAGEVVTTTGVEVSTADITSRISMNEIILAKALIDIKTSKPKAKGIVMQEPSETPTQTPIDYELTARLQEEERGELTIEEKSRLFVELMDKRKKYFARLRAEYIRKLMKGSKKAAESSSKRARATPLSSKSLTIVDYKIYKEGRKSFFKIIRADGSEKAVEGSSKRAVATQLSSKSPTIVDYKIYKEGRKSFFKIIRADGRIVRIKRLHDDLRVTAAQSYKFKAFKTHQCAHPKCRGDERRAIKNYKVNVLYIMKMKEEEVKLSIDYPLCSSPRSNLLFFFVFMDDEMITLLCGIKSQAGFKNRPPMRNKENYVPWSSRLLRYAKSIPNGKLIHNSIINGPYVRRMIPEPAIQTILLGLPEDIYVAVDSCETAQEIWLHVQQMMKGSDIGIQEKKAKLFNEWERFTSTDGELIESYYYYFLKLMNDLKQNKHFPKKIAKSDGNGNLVAARVEGNATGHNGNQIRCYNYKGLGHFVRNCTVKPRRRDAANLQTQLLIAQKVKAGIQLQAKEFDLMAAAADLDDIEEFNANCILMANLQQALTSGTQTNKAPVYDSDCKTHMKNTINLKILQVLNHDKKSCMISTPRHVTT
nr:hypothetical protein [Tanacetum cinerariifolium]